jgi:hypothetical protein
MSDYIYPEQVCHECAMEAKGRMPENHISTVNIKGICEVCHQQKPTTNPSDYGHPVFTKKRGLTDIEATKLLVQEHIRNAMVDEVAINEDAKVVDMLNKLTLLGLL